MYLDKIGDLYVFDCSFKEKEIPKKIGFEWKKQMGGWVTDRADIAKKLSEHAMPKLRNELIQATQKLDQALQASLALDSSLDIPIPQNKRYLPFQKAGIEFASQRQNTLIADTMGLGKTIQAIGVINLDESIQNILIICPASLKINWEKELREWLVRPLTIEIATTKKDFPKTNIVIINYDILKNFYEQLREKEWDLLIADEAHMIKNSKSKRTQQVIGKLVPRTRDKTNWQIKPISSKKKLFLTGTPILNRPIELWPLINTLDPETWNDIDLFTKRYCAAHKGRFSRWDMTGAANLEDLQIRLRSSIMIRRLKEDVLKDLPPKIRQIIPLPQNGSRRLVEAEREAYERYQAALHELRISSELLAAELHKDEFNKAIQNLRRGMTVAFGELAIARKATAVAKVPFVLEFLEGVSDKTIIFAHHKDVIKQLKDALGERAVVLDGSTSMIARNNAVERFQNDPSIQFFIGSIQAAGVGITLTAASHVIFAEMDWTPSSLGQAEDRAHRIGQVNSVLIQYLVFDESVDAHIAHTVIQKQEVIDKALNSPEAAAQLENLAFEEEIPVFVTEIGDPRDLATSHITPEDLETESQNIKPETILYIHSALRYLGNLYEPAGGEGLVLNKYDAKIANHLGSLPKLTPKQAALGRQVLQRYSQELGPQMIEFIQD